MRIVCTSEFLPQSLLPRHARWMVYVHIECRLCDVSLPPTFYYCSYVTDVFDRPTALLHANAKRRPPPINRCFAPPPILFRASPLSTLDGSLDSIPFTRTKLTDTHTTHIRVFAISFPSPPSHTMYTPFFLFTPQFTPHRLSQGQPPLVVRAVLPVLRLVVQPHALQDELPLLVPLRRLMGLLLLLSIWLCVCMDGCTAVRGSCHIYGVSKCTLPQPRPKPNSHISTPTGPCTPRSTGRPPCGPPS